MRLEEKKRVAEELSDRLKGSGTIYLTDFTGLNVKAITEFRSLLREQGVEYRVVKNTLMKRALEGLDLPDLSEHLEGPTALILSESDPVAPAKVVRDFAGEHDDRPVIKIGVVDGLEIGADQIEVMADLPSRDQLLGSIAGGLTAGVSGIAGALAAVIRDIAHMVGEVAKKNEAA